VTSVKSAQPKKSDGSSSSSPGVNET